MMILQFLQRRRRRLLSSSPSSSSFPFSTPKPFVQQLKYCDSAFNVERLVLAQPSFSSHELASAVSSLGSKRSTNRHVLTRVLKLVSTSDFASPQDLSSCLYGLAAGRLHLQVQQQPAASSPALPANLAHQLLHCDLSRFNSQDWADTLWALAKLAPPSSGPILARMRQHLSQKPSLSDFTSAELANSLWAIASSTSSGSSGASSDGRLEEKFALEIERRSVDQLSPQDISNYLWAFAQLGHKQPRIYALLANELMESRRQWRDFTPQAIANIAWAMAKADYKHPALFDSIADEIVHRRGGVQAFSQQALSSVVWAFAKLDFVAPRLFELASSEVQRRIQHQQSNRLPAQTLASTVWAFAKLGRRDPALFRSVSGELQRVLSSSSNSTTTTRLRPQELAMLCWSFATLRMADADLFVLLAREALACTVSFSFSPQETCQVLWAFATLNFPDDELFRAMAKHQMQQLPQLGAYSALDLATMAWSYATVDVQNEPLFDAIAARATQMLGSPQQVSSLVWAFATLHHPRSAALFSAVAREIAAATRGGDGLLRLDKFHNRALATVVWAFAERRGGGGGGEEEEALFKLASDEMLRRDLTRMSALAMGNVLEAYCRSGGGGFVRSGGRELGEHCAQELVRRRGGGVSPAHLTKLLQSLAALGVRDPALWTNASEWVLSQQHLLSTQEKCVLLRSFTKAGAVSLPVELAGQVMQDIESAAAAKQHDVVVELPLLADAVHALSKLEALLVQPSTAWLESVGGAITSSSSSSSSASPKQLVQLAWGLKRLGVPSTAPCMAWLDQALARELSSSSSSSRALLSPKYLMRALAALPGGDGAAGGARPAVERELLAQLSSSSTREGDGDGVSRRTTTTTLGDAELAMLVRSVAATHSKQQQTPPHVLLQRVEATLLANGAQRLRALSPRHLALVLSGYAQMRDIDADEDANNTDDDNDDAIRAPPHAKLFRAASDHLVSLLDDDGSGASSSSLPPHTLANLVWAFARSRNFSPALMERAARAFLANDAQPVRQVSTRALRDVLFAFSLTRHSDVVERIANELVLVRRDYNDSSSSNNNSAPHVLFLLSALVRHRLEHSPAFLRLTCQMLPPSSSSTPTAQPQSQAVSLSNFDVKALRQLLWTLANTHREAALDSAAPALVRAVVQELERRPLRDYSPKDMGVIARSLDLAGVQQEGGVHKMCSAFVREVVQNRDLRSVTNEDLAFLVKRLAMVDFYDKAFGDAVERELGRRGLGAFPNEHICMLLWSMRRLKRKTSALFELASAEIQSRDVKTFTSHELKEIKLCFEESGNIDRALLDYCKRGLPIALQQQQEQRERRRRG